MEQWKILNTWLIIQESFSNSSLRLFWDLLKEHNIYGRDILHALDSVFGWRELIGKIKSIIRHRIPYREKQRSFDKILIALERYPIFIDNAKEFMAQFIQVGGTIIIGDEVFNIFPGLKMIDDPPYILFVLGRFEQLSNITDTIGIVGTRSLSFNIYNYSCKLLDQLFKFKSSITTVSGYARGVDRLVYKKTVLNNAQHIAVLPVINKSKWKTYANEASKYRIIFLSEYLRWHNNVCKWEFVRRNRLIAGLSNFLMVMQAPLGSGACITAHFASSFNKNVYVLLGDLNNNQGGVRLVLDYGVGNFFTNWLHIFKFENEILYIRAMEYYRDSLYHILKSLQLNIVRVNLDYFIEVAENSKMDVSVVLKRCFRVTNKDIRKVMLKLSQVRLIKKGRKSYIFNIIAF